MRRLARALVGAAAAICIGSAAHAAQVVDFHPGASAAELRQAQLVRIQRGVRIQDLAVLRDDQFVQTPSGRQVQVGRLRRIQSLVQAARLHTSQPRAQGFPILAPAQGPGVAPRPGETAAQLLARPTTDVIRLKNGHTVTVAQLRAMAPYVEKRYGVDLSGRSAQRPRLDGPSTQIVSVTQLTSLPRNAPDSTILETPHHVRITLGELRAALKSRPKPAFAHTLVQQAR